MTLRSRPAQGSTASGPERIFRFRGWLSQQPAEFQTEFLRQGKVEQFAEGDYVVHAGEQPGGIFGIIEGTVGALVPAEDSGLRLAEILRAGDWFGFGPVFAAKQRTMTFRAMEPATLLKIELGRLNDFSREHPEFMRLLGTINFHVLSIAIDIVHDLLIPDSQRRIAATLLRISGGSHSPSSSSVREIRINQNELAEMANISRYSANRTLQSFERAGWIALGYRQIQIRNSLALREFMLGSRTMPRRPT